MRSLIHEIKIPQGDRTHNKTQILSMILRASKQFLLPVLQLLHSEDFGIHPRPLNVQSRPVGACEATGAGLETQISHLTDVDTVVDRPGRLEALHHALLEGFGQPVHPYEVLQVLGPGVIKVAAGVHPLDDGSHVTKHHSVH